VDHGEELPLRVHLLPAAQREAPHPLVLKVPKHGFENTWFPVTRATLEHRYPALNALFFMNLTQTTGVGVAVTVATFLTRLAQLDNPEGASERRGRRRASCSSSAG
jgi:hypothetical protein